MLVGNTRHQNNAHPLQKYVKKSNCDYMYINYLSLNVILKMLQVILMLESEDRYMGRVQFSTSCHEINKKYLEHMMIWLCVLIVEQMNIKLLTS